MRWMIYGADHKTGQELTVVIEADDANEAERRALYNDILVSSICRFAGHSLKPVVPRKAEPAAPPLNYCAPDSSAERRLPLTPPPPYKRIVAGARWLGGMSIAVRVVGCLMLLGALVLTLVPILRPVREWLPFQVHPELWFVGGGVLMAAAFACLFCGASIGMLSEIALALRDLARNSFRDEGLNLLGGGFAGATVTGAGGTDLLEEPAQRLLPGHRE